MWTSLRVRLLLMVILVMVSTLVLSNLITGWIIEQRFAYYLEAQAAQLAPGDLSAEENQRLFMTSVNHTLLLQVLLASVIASVVILYIAGYILRPVAALTAAARKIAAGDLRQRVAYRQRDEIGQLAQAFNTMADSLDRNECLRRQMVSDVAHELRSPLTNIRGYLEAFHEGVAAPEPELIAILYRETLFLNRLIDDLQELALAEAGQLRLDCQPLAIDGVIHATTDVLRGQAAARDIELVTRVPARLPLVQADAARAEQILRNLVKNALTHTPDGGTITVSAVERAGMVAVSVADTGHGIEPEHLPHVFERFYRADASRSRATGGSGLGLTIVRQLVEAQDGAIAVESGVGRGSVFTFTLPLARPVDASGPAGLPLLRETPASARV